MKIKTEVKITRRKFLRLAYLAGVSLSTLGLAACSPKNSGNNLEQYSPGLPKESIQTQPEQGNSAGDPEKRVVKAKVYLVVTENRKEGVKRCLALLGSRAYTGKNVLLKPNFNTADPAPGSTHNDTLEQLLVELQAAGPASLKVGERSGPPLTEGVLKEKGVTELCQRLGVPLINYDQLTAGEWVEFRREGLHWQKGFRFPKPVHDADINVATCLLKTHGYGGIFSMSLKLAVGLVPRRGYSYMTELHASKDMGKMIAEINLAYQSDFILMDGIDVFVDGGPDRGTRKKGNVMLVSQDRVALDAVGLAILKKLGSNQAIMNTPIFQQEQIARAVELGLGVAKPEDIELVSDDAAGENLIKQLQDILFAT
jgi:uncharacterized protein (DUF362 family)